MFFSELKLAIEILSNTNSEDDLIAFIKAFTQVVEKHAPIKYKKLRGNDAPFVTNELRKEIRHRSKLKNKAIREKTKVAKQNYKAQRNKCTKIKWENIQRHFSKIIATGFQNSKQFWRSIKPFLNDKGTHGQDEYILEENNKLIQDDKEIAEIFNEYYTNTVKYTTGSEPETVPLKNSADSIEAINEYHKHHSSIMAIKKNDIKQTFELPNASEEEIKEIIMNLDAKKAAGIDLISAKLLKLSISVTTPLYRPINSSILSANFPSELKIGKISPVYKNDKKAVYFLKSFTDQSVY